MYIWQYTSTQRRTIRLQIYTSKDIYTEQYIQDNVLLTKYNNQNRDLAEANVCLFGVLRIN